MKMHRATWRVGPALLLAGSFAVTAQEPADVELLLETASGIHELNGGRRMDIRGIRGTISLRLGPAGALRFEGRALDASRAHRPVALTLEDNVLVLGPAASDDGSPMLIDVLVPPELRVTVDASHSKLLVGGMHSDLDVRGERVEAKVRGVQARAGFDVVRSALEIEGVNELSLEADESTATVQHVYGPLHADMAGGTLSVTDFESFDGYFEGVATELRQAKGPVLLEATGGRLGGVLLEGGGDIKLEGTTADLRQCKGELRIETDAPLALEKIEGPLNVRSSGAELRGGDLGPFRIESDAATVVLQNLNGAAEIHGTGLELQVVGAKDSVQIFTSGSQVKVGGTEKELAIESEFGDVELTGTSGPVTVKSRNGAVHAIAAEGPLQIEADGPVIDASWASFRGVENSTLYNESGDLRVLLPGGHRCMIEAEAPSGRIESKLAGVQPSSDGHTAQGEYTGGFQAAPQVKKPVLQLTTEGGNIYLGSSAEN